MTRPDSDAIRGQPVEIVPGVVPRQDEIGGARGRVIAASDRVDGQFRDIRGHYAGVEIDERYLLDVDVTQHIAQRESIASAQNENTLADARRSASEITSSSIRLSLTG